MNYRKSNYCIDVKLDKADGKYMLVHSYTGALDIVSDELVGYLKSNKEFGKDDFPFSETTFDLLAKRGHITQKSTDDEREHVRRFATLLHENAKNSPKQFLFMVTYDCNFRCTYCYEGGISKQGSQWSKKSFTKETVDRAYKAMEELEPDKNKRSNRIFLYGGEPFLKENVDIVEYIIDQGSALGYEFSAVTNGHDLEHYKHIFAKGHIKFMQITLDGTKEMHNSRRYHHETGDSFDIIFKNIGIALDNNIAIEVRFNADVHNFGEAKKLEQLFDKAGYAKQKRFHFYTAMLDGGLNSDDESISLMDLDLTHEENDKSKNDNINYLSRKEFNTMYENSGLEASHQDYGLYKKLYSAIHNGSYLQYKSIACPSQTNMYIFDPYGNLYNCWETVGKKNHVVGTYFKGIEFLEEINKWHVRNIGNTTKCNNCKYGLFCGGGCLAKALRAGGFEKSYCDNYGDIFRLTVNAVFDNWQHSLI